MQPHRPQPHQQAYYPPLQSRGFNPPPQQARPPQQVPFQQPPPSGYAQQYQSHPQYQQPRPAQYYQQPPPPQQFGRPQPPPQQRYAPQPHTAPHPAPTASRSYSQGHYPPVPAPAQTNPQYVPSTSYPQQPVVPPARANSRSPDKAGRPLPAPAAAPAPQQSQNVTVPVSRGFAPPVQSQFAGQSTPYSRANPPTSSFAGLPPSQSFPRGQPFQSQPPVQHPQPRVQPQVQPPVHHISPPQAHQSLPRAGPSPVNGTPPVSPIRTPDSPTKRPLPAPPGGAAPSPPVTPARSGAPAASAAVSPPQRRALPYSPTPPPNAEVARNSGRSAIRPPQRSSTLPAPLASQDTSNNAPPSVSKDDTEQPSVARPGHAKDPSPVETGASAPLRNTGFALPPSVQSRSSSGFALPQQQKPTQSLAFRLASLSLKEEQSQKRPSYSIPRIPQVPASAPNRSAAPFPPSARSAAKPVIDLDDAPPTSSIRRSPFEPKAALPQPPSLVPAINVPGDDSDEVSSSGESDSESKAPSVSIPLVPSINISEAPSIHVSKAPADVSEAPSINVSEAPSINVSEAPSISISEAPSIAVSAPPSINQSEVNVSETPTINISEASVTNDVEGPSITVSEATPKITVSELPAMSVSSISTSIPDIIVADLEGTLDTSVNTPAQKRKGLICYGCGYGILGRIVSAMGGRWHPACFKCSVCSELLEHVSSYEHGGKPYCHLDYHEKFAPQCYHCRTPIIDERFITLDDPALGKRMYHEQHFFCAECGDPFLAPTIPGKQNDTDSSSVVTQDDDVGFTVYKGHPYCEACHVRLRYPKCKRCKKSIRDGMQAVEALGGKWCWECFLCAGCEKPFEDPAFFQRDNKAYCEPCFSVIIKSEL